MSRTRICGGAVPAILACSSAGACATRHRWASAKRRWSTAWRVNLSRAPHHDPPAVDRLPVAAERLRQPTAAARKNPGAGLADAIACAAPFGWPEPGLAVGDPARRRGPSLVDDGPAGHSPGPAKTAR